MLTAVLLLLERRGSEGLEGLVQGLCALGLPGPDSQAGVGAREGLLPGRVGDCKDPIGFQDAWVSKACYRGVRLALIPHTIGL